MSATVRALSIPVVILVATASPVVADAFADRAAPFLRQHCYECHGAEKAKGGIEVHGLLSTDDAFRNHHFLERIAEAVEFGDMPPDDQVDEADLPRDAERETFLEDIREVLQRLEKGEFPRNPGRPTIRRLNRNEYAYTVRHLFGVNFNASHDFPSDGAGGSGFDNTGDALFVPPVLMEKYLAASRRVIDAVYASDKLRDAIIFSKPGEDRTPEAAAREVLLTQGSLAFRRGIADDELGRLMALFSERLEAGDSYEDSLRGPLRALLMHPSFLFREEQDVPGKSEWRINDLELATRLSYFLWSSMPDRELFHLADQGMLSDPKVLKAQTLRMIADPKSAALTRHFGGQWLGFEDLREVAEPDPKRFPGFTPTLRVAIYRESVDFLHHILEDNRSLLELVHADYTFLNGELARHYGIPHVSGSRMRKVALTDRNRGGVIGQASILTVTSMPLRTSPVKRGTWILDNLLGTPPPPPPQDAGVLPADDKSVEGLSFREQLEIHRTKASCAGCHEKIDPLGFGLENFDAIGRWRTTDVNGKPVDSLAVLPGDITFSKPTELKKLLLEADALFLKNITRRMLAYALGRPLEYYDEPVVANIVAELRENELRAHALILAIVNSHPFQHRSAKR